MIKKVLLATILASIVGIVVLYVVGDLGNRFILVDAFKAHYLRDGNLIGRDKSQLIKYFCAFFLSNLVWSYIFAIRQESFEGSGIEKGVKFFFLLWLLTIPIQFWFWVFIPFAKKLLAYYIFYYLVLFLCTGAVIGKVCSDQ